MDLAISDELMDGYGYPQITRADKEAILGLNFARMLGMDLARAVASASPIPGRP
jgi:hypothetical protein